MIFTLAKKSALIVEDFAEFARSVRAMLHTVGATNVDIVYNAEDAIESCKNRKYDIILSDYNLGSKKDGQQLLEELSKYKLLKSDCVFLMLTAENTSAMVMGAMEFQPDSYIAKPFTGDLLKSRLQKALEKKDALQSINRAIANKQWDTALEQIEKSIKEFPKYRMFCLRSQFHALKALNKFDQALELVTNIVAERSIPWAMQAVGEIFYLKNKPHKAIEIFKSMIVEFPMSLEGYDWLAKLQGEAGQPVEAQITLTKAIEKSPKALQRQKQLGRVAEINKDLEVMTKAYRAAVKHGKNSAFSSPDEYIKLTSALTQKILKNSPETITNKIIDEAESVFRELDKCFSSSSAAQLRSNIAHAQFCKASRNEEKQQKYLNLAEKNLRDIDELISPDVSIELSRSLKILDKPELAENIITEAIQQNIDDTEFVKKASQLTSNQELIQNSQRASQYNLKAIDFFKRKKYSDATCYFEKSHKLSPTNINICLNLAQTLLKHAQIKKDSNEKILQAESLINNMSPLNFSDDRYPRYSELSRLIQLMSQQQSI